MSESGSTQRGIAAVTDESLAEIAARLVQALSPEKIILFGSRAWGQPKPDSDVDLLVIVADSDQPAYRRAQQAHRALRGVRVPCDILVRTRAEMERVPPLRASLLHRILQEGKVLHG